MPSQKWPLTKNGTEYTKPNMRNLAVVAESQCGVGEKVAGAVSGSHSRPTVSIMIGGVCSYR